MCLLFGVLQSWWMLRGVFQAAGDKSKVEYLAGTKSENMLALDPADWKYSWSPEP